MTKQIQEPVVTERERHGSTETITTHPAFAQISASRVSGSTNLYGSDFRHNHFMTVTIRRSELNRSLHRDWHFGRDEIIEVAMSESQWATFVSAPNVGAGVPCTIQHENRQYTPGLPDPKARHDQFGEEMLNGLRIVLTHVDELIAGAKTKTQASELNSLRQMLEDRLPFVAKQFGEHMEGTVEKAKQEVHGYMTGAISRAGISALNAETPPLSIEYKDERNDEDR